MKGFHDGSGFTSSRSKNNSTSIDQISAPFDFPSRGQTNPIQYKNLEVVKKHGF
jgi:hypothetical protein